MPRDGRNFFGEIWIDDTKLTSTAAELNILDGVTATAAEINEAADRSSTSNAIVTITANDALTQAEHAGRIVIVNKADGCALTLPEATGTGDVYTVVFGTAITANTHTITTADTTNADLVGWAIHVDLDAATTPLVYTSLQSAGNDVITANATTQGGVNPYMDWYRLTDLATDVWSVEGRFSVPAGSNPATPFSST